MKRIMLLTVLLFGLLLEREAQAFYNPNTGRWLSRDPIEEKGGLNLYSFFSNNAICFFDVLGMCNCEQMRKDIDGFEKAKESLQDMANNWTSGQSFKDYNIAPAADAAGGRSSTFIRYADCTKAIINDIEGDLPLNATFAAGLGMVGGVGYYSLGLHGLVHGTTAEEQWVLTRNAIERARNGLLLKRLRDKYQEECMCSLQRIKEI